MQTLAAYLLFLLVVVAVGLLTIVGAIAALAISEGIAWVKDRPAFRRCESTVIGALISAGTRIEQQVHSLHQVIHGELVRTNHGRAQ